MAPSAIVEHTILDKALATPHVEMLPLGKPAPKLEVQREVKPAFEFSKAVLLEENHFKTGSRTLKVVISVLTHVAVISVPILFGLFFTDTINIKQYAGMILVAPPPPPPPPPAASAVVKVAPVHRTFMNAGKLIAPTVIPKQIADIKEAPLETESLGGGAGGVPGGVPGGQMGGVLGGVIGGVSTTSGVIVIPSVSAMNGRAELSGMLNGSSVHVARRARAQLAAAWAAAIAFARRSGSPSARRSGNPSFDSTTKL